MVAGKDRSRTKRKVFVRTPGGDLNIHRRRRKPSKPVCGVCGAELHGVARGIPAQVNKLSKTQKRPERPYGGVLCSKCMRKKIAAGVKKWKLELYV